MREGRYQYEVHIVALPLSFVDPCHVSSIEPTRVGSAELEDRPLRGACSLCRSSFNRGGSSNVDGMKSKQQKLERFKNLAGGGTKRDWRLDRQQPAFLAAMLHLYFYLIALRRDHDMIYMWGCLLGNYDRWLEEQGYFVGIEGRYNRIVGGESWSRRYRYSRGM